MLADRLVLLGSARVHLVRSQQPPRDTRERVEIGTSVDVTSECLLRWDVTWRADDRADLRQASRWRRNEIRGRRRCGGGGLGARFVHRVHDAEIEDLEHIDLVSAAAHEQVGGLYVAVKQTRFVRLGERLT